MWKWFTQRRFIPVQDILEERKRSAEHISLRKHWKTKQQEGKDRIIDSLLEIIKNQKEPASEPKASAIVQRTPVKFPEYDPNVDTLTKPMFSESDFKQPPEDTQKPGEAIYLPNLTASTQPKKTGSCSLKHSQKMVHLCRLMKQ